MALTVEWPPVVRTLDPFEEASINKEGVLQSDPFKKGINVGRIGKTIGLIYGVLSD